VHSQQGEASGFAPHQIPGRMAAGKGAAVPNQLNQAPFHHTPRVSASNIEMVIYKNKEEDTRGKKPP